MVPWGHKTLLLDLMNCGVVLRGGTVLYCLSQTQCSDAEGGRGEQCIVLLVACAV